MSRSFAVTWDYRCPFARNAHEHIVAGLRGGADWDVEFLPFSLNQMHIEEGSPPVWEDNTHQAALLAPQVALVVRDEHPEKFLDVHEALFTARHDEARDIRERDVIGEVLRANGVDDVDHIFDVVDGGGPLEEYRKIHEDLESGLKVFGVPTFIIEDRAVFVRLMHRPEGDAEVGTQAVERVLDLLEWRELNEFKHTRIPR